MAPMKVISVIFCSGGMHHEKRYSQSATALTFIMKEKEKAAPLF